jgi:hypothetical protein
VDLIQCIYDAEVAGMETLGAGAEQLLHAQRLGLVIIRGEGSGPPARDEDSMRVTPPGMVLHSQ